MKYYELWSNSEDDARDTSFDIISSSDKNADIDYSTLVKGKWFDGWDDRFKFYYDKKDGDVATDWLCNDMDWILVSQKLKSIFESVDTEIQFIPVEVIEKSGIEKMTYYIANIIRTVDAICIEESTHFFATHPDGSKHVSVIKPAIYGDRVGGSDIFKLSYPSIFPNFASEKFQKLVRENNITGVGLDEILVV